ncbi:MAG TPA: hypothetical protein VGE24_09790 [Emticicia sp.]
MKKVLLLFLTPIIFSSCQQKLIRPLKGSYPSDYTVVSEKSSDEIWDNVIAFCSKNGIPIKLTDRKTGLIISKPYKLVSYTYENQDGTPREKEANVIIGCESVGTLIADCQLPTIIWTNIIFKLNEENNKTSLTVRLSDLTAWYSQWRYLKEAKSTGRLEKQIIKEIF